MECEGGVVKKAYQAAHDHFALSRSSSNMLGGRFDGLGCPRSLLDSADGCSSDGSVGLLGVGSTTTSRSPSAILATKLGDLVKRHFQLVRHADCGCWVW
jgi:hypothetical protein